MSDHIISPIKIAPTLSRVLFGAMALIAFGSASAQFEASAPRMQPSRILFNDQFQDTQPRAIRNSTFTIERWRFPEDEEYSTKFRVSIPTPTTKSPSSPRFRGTDMPSYPDGFGNGIGGEGIGVSVSAGTATPYSPPVYAFVSATETDRRQCAKAVEAYISDRVDKNSPAKPAYVRDCLADKLPTFANDAERTAVSLRRSGSSTSPFCSGVIVEPGVLLTARHCLFSPDGGGATVMWTQLEAGTLEIITGETKTYRVRCAESEADKKSTQVALCAERVSRQRFDIDKDYIVLNIEGLEPGFQGMSLELPKPGTELLLYGQFDGVEGRRFSKTGCSLIEVRGRCALHRCQAGLSSSGAPMYFRGEGNTLRLAGIHVSATSDSRSCGMSGSEQFNVGVLLRNALGGTQ